MRPLVVTVEIRARIAVVLAYAEKTVMSWAEVQARGSGVPMAATSEDENRNVDIPIGYRCVFNFEMQRAWKCRHLSVSVDTPGKYPNELAVHEIAKLFGFDEGAKGPNVIIFVEREGGKIKGAVDLIEPFAP